MRLEILFKTLICSGLVLAGLPGGVLRAQVAPITGVTPPNASVLRALPVGAPPPAAPVTTQITPSLSAPASSQMTGGIENSTYDLVPEDVVTVKVFQEDDLLTTARIAKDGSITFPLIGTVAIAGKTPDDAARLIAGELAKNYLVNPQVTITVVEYSKRSFTVLGEVQKPGSYDMPDRRGVTLLEAIGAAGGYTRIADPAKIRLKRLADGKETIFRLNAKSMASERETTSFEIKPGDIITVGESIF